MKIVCPKCQAAYEIDVPESPQKDISAKCAVCNSKFPVKKKSPSKTSHAHNTMSGPPLAQINSESDTDSADDFLFGLKDDFGELHRDNKDKSFEDENNLDDYLDQFLEDDPGKPENKSFDQSVEPPSEKSSSAEQSSSFETPSEEELDDLFDSIITEEIKTVNPKKESTVSDSSIETNWEEENLDTLFDDLINDIDPKDPKEGEEDIDETEAALADPDFPAKEDGEIDQGLFDLLEGEIPEVKIATSDDALTADDSVAGTMEEGLLEEAPSEEPVLDKTDLEEDGEITSYDEQETPVPEPAIKEPEDEPQAEAVADSDALKMASVEEEPKEASDEAQTIAGELIPETDNEKSDDDLWAEAFTDQEALNKTPGDEEAKEASDEAQTIAGEPIPETDDEKSEDDLWAEAFTDQEALNKTPADEETKETSDEVPTIADQDEPIPEPNDEKSGDEPQAEAVAETDEAVKEDSQGETPTDPEEEPKEENALSESDYDDWDDEKEDAEVDIEDQYGDYDDDEEEYSPPEKKKSGIFNMPSTRTGKLVLGGGVVAVLLTAGGVYFALQTLAPPELKQMGKNVSEIPDGLKPKQVDDTSMAPPQASGSATASINQQDPRPASPSARAPIPGASSAKTPDIAKALGKAIDPLEAAMKPDVSEGLLASLAPSNHSVQLTTILPVAFNVNDIRVLSFSLEAEMSDAESARVVREALPVFEKITITTVEKLMDKKFFNDILYVQEKLKKNLQTNFNKALEGGGRVKKINFREFTIQ